MTTTVTKSIAWYSDKQLHDALLDMLEDASTFPDSGAEPESSPQELLRQIVSWTRPTGMILGGRSVRQYLSPFHIPDYAMLVKDSAGYMTFLITDGKTIPNRMFTSHVDTVQSDYLDATRHGNLYLPDTVEIVDGCLKLKYEAREHQGRRCLGADDGAGMAIMLSMMQKGVYGWYTFFADEEIGMKGSSMFLDDMAVVNNTVDAVLAHTLEHVVAFDRKDADVIAFQCGEQTVSTDTYNALHAALCDGYTNDEHGAFTDSYKFRSDIAEGLFVHSLSCTNLGIGYDGCHMVVESVNLPLFNSLVEKYCTLDWDNILKADKNFDGLNGAWDDDDFFAKLDSMESDVPAVWEGYTDYASPRLSTAASVVTNNAEIASQIQEVVDYLKDEIRWETRETREQMLLRFADFIVDKTCEVFDI